MIDKLRESSTFKLVVISWVIATVAFAYSQYIGKDPIPILDYAKSVGLILTVWLGREWRAAHYPKDQ